MDTNVVALAREIAHSNPQQIATQIAAWSGALVALAMAIGRAFHAFQEGAGIISGVFRGTNAKTPDPAPVPPPISTPAKPAAGGAVVKESFTTESTPGISDKV
jgi:hypothetical protein